ncbi:MAG TPA: sigma-70 family RNA polymerase sigma factor [Acidimicrobiia bacterium]|nr:sigma-70 family RNA polymerase sigma factor [Acidimicrobiia bacterium]
MAKIVAYARVTKDSRRKADLACDYLGVSNDAANSFVDSRAVDAAWFQSFYEEALPVVYGYFFRRCGGDREVVADLTQETFVSAYRSLRRGVTVESPLPWIVTIARLRLIDHLRRRAADKQRLDSKIVEVEVGPGWTSDGEVRLAEALDRLNEKYQLVLVLRYVDDLPVKEVAKLLGRSMRATESLLVRARGALSRAYEALAVRKGM